MHSPHQYISLTRFHIYSQLFEHCEARIIGNDAGLRVLRDTIIEALREGQAESDELLAGDGEGYQVEVTMMPDDWKDPRWDKPENRPHYCDRGYDALQRVIVIPAGQYAFKGIKGEGGEQAWQDKAW